MTLKSVKSFFPLSIYSRSGSPRLDKVFQGSGKGILGKKIFPPNDVEFCSMRQPLSWACGLSRWNPSRLSFPRAVQEPAAPLTAPGGVGLTEEERERPQLRGSLQAHLLPVQPQHEGKRPDLSSFFGAEQTSSRLSGCGL